MQDEIVARILIFAQQELGLSTEDAMELFAVSRKGLSRNIASADAALAAGDAEAAAMAAHRLKGDLRNLGLFDLAGLAQSVESGCADEPARAISELETIRTALAPILE